MQAQLSNLLLAIAICCLSMVLWMAIRMIIKEIVPLYKRRLDLDEYAVHLGYDIEKSRKILDDMVSDALVKWSIFNVRSNDEAYINDKKRDECMKWVIEWVIENSSPAVIEQISIGYPANDRDEYISSIKNVAMFHVTNFVIKQNTATLENDIPNVNIQL